MRYMMMGILIMALALPALAAEPERPRCENCGMFEDVSPTRATAVFKSGDTATEHHFESLICIMDFNRSHYDGQAEVSDVRVLDYATFGTDTEQLLDATKASFLYGTSLLKGSMPPYVAAFANKEAAKKAQGNLGGDLLDFKAMLTRLSAAGEEEDQAPPAGPALAATYVCPCSGDCCADIKSDKPGTCPNCGMELVPASGK